MGNVFLHGKSGGSGGLNFRVIGGTSAPSNPKENDIWINTDVKITSWVFSATEPENPVPGMVWISTGKASSVEFNALKKNGIQVYPISAKQYVNGEWINVPTETRLNGEWTSWWNGELYWLGEKHDFFTTNLVVDDNLTYTENEASITLRTKYYTGAVKTILKDIDVTDYSTFCVNIIDVSRNYANNVGNATASISLLQNGVSFSTIQLADLNNTYKGLKEVNLSTVDGPIDIVFTLYAYCATTSVYMSVTFNKMYLER